MIMLFIIIIIKVSSAAPRTFLHKWSGDPNFLHGLNSFTGKHQPSPLGACATRALAQTLIKARYSTTLSLVQTRVTTWLRK